MKKQLDKYIITETKEKNLWQDCLFVFDSSALLNFYEYSTETRKNIFDTTFKVIEDKLWIPNHVEFEFLKNRETTLRKPISTYNQLISSHYSKIEENLKQIKSKTKKDHKHPYVSEKIFIDLDNELEKFKKLLSNEIKTRIEEIENLSENDDVLNAFDKYFKVGKKFNYAQISSIIKEGEFRYKYSIPPGYKDLESKIGFQIFGDLIIWKQIIEYSKALNKPIIFVIDDVKEDWWTLDKKNNPLGPRTELIDEIDHNSNTPFWMYTTLQFLEKSKDLLGSKIKENAIKEVRDASIQFSGMKAEEAFIRWVIESFDGDGEVIYPEGDFYGVDLVLVNENKTIGFKTRYFPRGYHQHMNYRLNKTLENIKRRAPKYNCDKIYLVLITESKNSAIEILKEIKENNNQLYLFEDSEIEVDYLYGYIENNNFIPVI